MWVYLGDACEPFSGISAIGVAHTDKRLVLVPEGEGSPLEIPSDKWTTFEVERDESPSTSKKAPAEQVDSGYRLITLDDDQGEGS